MPGASAVFRGGVVAYASDLKVSLLGVPDSVVATSGVVSADCAAAMARGVRSLTGATYAVATTGVAGPAEQEGKAPGTVYTAAPVISGGTNAGSTLSVTNGTWNYLDLTYSYRWFSNGAAIRGATRSTYVVPSAAAGRTIRARVTASRPGNDSVSSTSNSIQISN